MIHKLFSIIEKFNFININNSVHNTYISSGNNFNLEKQKITRDSKKRITSNSKF